MTKNEEDQCWAYSNLIFRQPSKPKPAIKTLNLATHKDMKLSYDKIRLNTWCEDFKFTLVTQGTYLEFDDI